VLRYLNGTILSILVYRRSTYNKSATEGFVDANYAWGFDTKKSLSWYVFTLFGNTICWNVSLQLVVTLSTT